jgi:hypothetical protein
MSRGAAAPRAAERRHLLILTVAWLAAAAIVNPAGNFPLSDDWSYAHSVRTLLAEHVWRLTDFTSVPIGTQLLWGALFCLPAGFSFVALRVSTLVLAWLTGVGVYRLLRACGSHETCALIATAGVLFCPVVFALAFTFMTDIPALACSVWACVFAVKHADRRRWITLAAATSLFVAATLVRQIGVTIAVGAAAAFIVRGHTRRKYLDAIVVILCPVTALLAYNAFLSRTALPLLYDVHDRDVAALLAAGPVGLITTVLSRSLHSYIYLGLFLLPIAALIRWPPAARSRRPIGMAIVAGTGLLLPAGIMLLRHHPLPFLPHILHNTGLNPIMIARDDLWPRTPAVLWTVLTVAAGISAGLVTWRLIEGLADSWTRQAQARPAIVLCVVALGAYLVPLFILSALLDRYLLVPLVLTVALLALGGEFHEAPRKTHVAAAIAVLSLTAAFDVAAAHDLLAFNRARWTAVDSLLGEGVAAEKIDGGYEVDRWLTYRPPVTIAEINTWWNRRDAPEAIVSLGPMKGFEAARRYTFTRWLGTRGLGADDGVVYVLRKR